MTVLGNRSLYPECKSHNHKQLQQPWRKHAFNEPGPADYHDENLKAGWYRIDGQAGQRLLDITDIPKNVFNRTLVRLILKTTYVNNLEKLQLIFTKLWT